jgi:MoaA/NifB/PqqE/SkfB family radical SAM enzyme
MEGRGGYLKVLGDRVRSRRFNSLFLFVTSRCNSLCRTCFYFDKLNSRDDLTFEQIGRIAQSAPPFGKLWLSGGEPFLRDELAEIVAMFARHNGVRHVNLPTNGLLPDRIFRETDRMLALCPEVTIDLNFSLDGLANTHDAIRGVPNNFVRTMATMQEAERRYKDERRLRRNVLTVITRENYEEIVALGLHLMREGTTAGQYFEVVRGQAPDPSLKKLTREQVAELHRKLMPIHRHYAEKLMAHLPGGVRQVAKMYYLGNLRFHFDLHEQCMEGPTRWPMACTAGETSLVIDHNGRFRACEMREPVGNLADFGFDVRRALASDALREEVAAIPGANCWCTHSCFIQDSSKFSPRVQLFHIPWAWLRQRLARLPDMDVDEIARFKAAELS